jgi:hypothetical protein
MNSVYNERDRRLFTGFLARTFGCGGVTKAAEITELSRKRSEGVKKSSKTVMRA